MDGGYSMRNSDSNCRLFGDEIYYESHTFRASSEFWTFTQGSSQPNWGAVRSRLHDTSKRWLNDSPKANVANVGGRWDPTSGSEVNVPTGAEMNRGLEIQILVYMAIIAGLSGRFFYLKGLAAGKEIGFTAGFMRGKKVNKDV